MNNSTRGLLTLCSVFILTLGLHTSANASELPQIYYPDPIEVNLSTDEVNLSTEWQKYSFSDGVLIEYRMEIMNSKDYDREVNMMIFRFTNTTDQLKDCSWMVKIDRNNKCYNCSNLENTKTEEIFNLLLNPKETVQGNSSNLVTRPELNVFGNFVKLAPGMSEERLTGFELVNLTIK